MENLNKKFLTRVVGACMLIAAGSSAVAQQIPASSADSGRRAIVSINQGNIYNNISTAQNTANNAYYAAANAQNGADGAAGLAAEALRRAGEGGTGSILAGTFVDIGIGSTNIALLGSYAPTTNGNSNGFFRVACVVGANSSPYVIAMNNQPTWCPGGATWVGFGYVAPLQDGGGSGGS